MPLKVHGEGLYDPPRFIGFGLSHDYLSFNLLNHFTIEVWGWLLVVPYFRAWYILEIFTL